MMALIFAPAIAAYYLMRKEGERFLKSHERGPAASRKRRARRRESLRRALRDPKNRGNRAERRALRMLLTLLRRRT